MNRLMQSLAIAVFLSASYAAQAQSGSYVKLRGARLARFEKTAAASEARRPIQINLPATLLSKGGLSKLGKSRNWVCFEHRKVLYYLKRQNPYLVQSLRKAAKKGASQMLVKGKVKSLRRDGKRIWAVRVSTIQVKVKRKKRA